MSHMCKRIFIFELQLSSYWQNIKFSRYCPKFHIFTNIVIFQVYLQLLDQLLHPYKFYGRDMSGILFFYFCQMWAIKLFLSPLPLSKHLLFLVLCWRRYNFTSACVIWLLRNIYCPALYMHPIYQWMWTPNLGTLQFCFGVTTVMA